MKMKCFFLFRITLIFFILLLAQAIFPQDAGPQESEPEIEAKAEIVVHVFSETSMRTLTVGAPWTLMLYVDHDIPDEVTVNIPAFAPSLFLDRIVKTPGIVNTQTQTIIEYRFIPSSPGRFFIEPFTVITPHGVAVTERYILDVRSLNTEQRMLTPRISWEGSPRQMAAGERLTITLRVTGWTSGSAPSMAPDFFMPEIPKGAILASLPLLTGERESGMVLKLELIPLETGNFILPARTLQFENTLFQIPVLNIRVTNAGNRAPLQIDAEDVERNNLPDSGTSPQEDIQFPDFILSASEKNISESRQKQCESIYNKAKDLWEKGLHAQALAELRSNERYHPEGALLQPIRQEAEKKLGFLKTENENREKQITLLIFTFSFFILVIISLFVCFLLKRGMFVKRTSLVCAVIFAAAGFFCIYRYMDSNAIFRGNRFGVTNETSVRRTADFEGEELFRFREGQPVVIMLNSGVWVYVRANDAEGKSGWISSTEVIFY